MAGLKCFNFRALGVDEVDDRVDVDVRIALEKLSDLQ